MTQAFITEVDKVIARYEQFSGYAAARTRQMIERYGEVNALSRLMATADLQQGFKVLRDNGQLEYSFEALVVRFRHMFTSDAVKAAQWRLAHPYDLL